MILGFVGLLTLLTCPVFIICGHFIGIETFEVPTWKTMGFLTFDAIIGMFYEFFFSKATTYIGPLTANMSLAAIIPFTMVIDFFWTLHFYSAFYVIASITIIQAVVCMNLEENFEQQKLETTSR